MVLITVPALYFSSQCFCRKYIPQKVSSFLTAAEEEDNVRIMCY